MHRYATGLVRLQGKLKGKEKIYTIFDGHSTDYTRKKGAVPVLAIKCQKAQVLVYAHFLNAAFYQVFKLRNYILTFRSYNFKAGFFGVMIDLLQCDERTIFF